MTHRPLRIAHLADSHLGYRAWNKLCPETGRNQRSVDVEHAFTAAIEDILTREVDLIIHAGDLFHHTRPSWSTLRSFVRAMRKVEAAGIPTVIIGGNHDTPRLRTSGSVFSLLELALPGIRFEAGYDLVELPIPDHNLIIHAVPHGALTNPTSPAPLLVSGKRNVMITHGLTPGAQLRGGSHIEPGEALLAADLLDTSFDYIALGHFHLAGSQGHNAWYAGSTERMGWGDESVTPGFLLVTLTEAGAAPLVETVPISVARPMKTLHPLSGEGETAESLAARILDRLRALDSAAAMARIELRDVARPLRREVETIVLRECAQLVWALRIHSPSDVRGLFEQPVGDRAFADLPTHFADFVSEREQNGSYDPTFAAAFRERGQLVLAAALRQAEETAAATEPVG